MNLIILCICSFAVFELAAQEPKNEMRLSDLDAEIKRLQQLRAKAAMNAYIAQDKADQFIDQDWLAYRSAIARQQMYQQQVDELDAQIESLTRQRAALEQR